MCTNIDLITLEPYLQTNIDELKSNNDFVEILTPTRSESNVYKRTCYSRKELITGCLNKFSEVPTYWNNERHNDRVKGIYKLPATGEYITEDSFRLLYCDYIQTFQQVDCGEYVVGSYFGVGRDHGNERKICKLVPLIEVSERDIQQGEQGVLSIQLPSIPETEEETEEKLEKKHYKIDRLVTPFINPKKGPLDYEYGYKVTERQEIIDVEGERYREIYYFPTQRTPEQIFFNMDKNRVEERWLRNCCSRLYVDISGIYHTCWLDIFIDNIDNGPYYATFELSQTTQVGRVNIIEDKIYEDRNINYPSQKTILSFNNKFLAQKV
ncbi:hypothetical protein EBU71_23485, partial [bacterium]|nr:hypothetical protein [Candidatus Elulimicrobium humile]